MILNAAQNECVIDSLGRSPCQSHGVCIDHINNYTCHCSGSYTGVNCSEEGTINVYAYIIIILFAFSSAFR